MKLTDFKIGETFYCGTKKWRCTDIGTRIITAIDIGKYEDVSWYNGPPYAVSESVFDEFDQEGCHIEVDESCSKL